MCCKRHDRACRVDTLVVLNRAWLVQRRQQQQQLRPSHSETLRQCVSQIETLSNGTGELQTVQHSGLSAKAKDTRSALCVQNKMHIIRETEAVHESTADLLHHHQFMNMLVCLLFNRSTLLQKLCNR